MLVIYLVVEYKCSIGFSGNFRLTNSNKIQFVIYSLEQTIFALFLGRVGKEKRTSSVLSITCVS
jgi:hypothetical protein